MVLAWGYAVARHQLALVMSVSQLIRVQLVVLFCSSIPVVSLTIQGSSSVSTYC